MNIVTNLLLLAKLLRHQPENFFWFIIQYPFNKRFKIKVNHQEFYQNSDKSVLYHIIHSYSKIEKMVKMIPADAEGTIIDGGANNGLFSFLASFKFQGKIFAFEPSDVLIPVLKKNFSNKNIELITKALSDKTGFVTFYISSQSDQASSLIKRNVLYFEKKPNRFKEITVEAITLDEFVKQEGIKRISILKLDLQGSEYSVLKNSISVLEKTDYLLIEVTFLESGIFDMIELIRKYFQYHIVINPVFLGADILFSKKELTC